MPKMLTPSDIRATIGAGMSITQARKILRCPTRIIRQWARVYGVAVPMRPAKARGREQWRKAAEDFGPGVRAIARGLGIDHKWVAEQLARYGIEPGHGRSGRPIGGGEPKGGLGGNEEGVSHNPIGRRVFADAADSTAQTVPSTPGLVAVGG